MLFLKCFGRNYGIDITATEPICSLQHLVDSCAFVLMSEDVLTEDKGECVICLDDLQQGDVIARLPCLCIYHKR